MQFSSTLTGTVIKRPRGRHRHEARLHGTGDSRFTQTRSFTLKGHSEPQGTLTRPSQHTGKSSLHLYLHTCSSERCILHLVSANLSIGGFSPQKAAGGPGAGVSRQERCQSRHLHDALGCPSRSAPHGDRRTAVHSGILASRAESQGSREAPRQAHLSGLSRTLNAFPATLPPSLGTYP